MLHTVTQKAAAGWPHTTHTKLSDEGAACLKSKGAEINSLTANMPSLQGNVLVLVNLLL